MLSSSSLSAHDFVCVFVSKCFLITTDKSLTKWTIRKMSGNKHTHTYIQQYALLVWYGFWALNESFDCLDAFVLGLFCVWCSWVFPSIETDALMHTTQQFIHIHFPVFHVLSHSKCVFDDCFLFVCLLFTFFHSSLYLSLSIFFSLDTILLHFLSYLLCRFSAFWMIFKLRNIIKDGWKRLQPRQTKPQPMLKNKHTIGMCLCMLMLILNHENGQCVVPHSDCSPRFLFCVLLYNHKIFRNEA